MPANLENSAVATGLEKVSFHSNPKERQCQGMLKLPHNCYSYCLFCIIRKTLSLVAQVVKNLPAVQGNPGSVPGLGRFPRE